MPSGLKATPKTGPDVAAENSRRLIGTRGPTPEPRFQSRTVPSWPAEASVLPSPANAMPATHPWCPRSTLRFAPVARVPDPNLPAGLRTGHSRSRQVECQAVDRAVMAGNSPDNLIRGGFPEQEARRFGGAGELASVRFERDAAEGTIVAPQRLQIGMEAPAEMMPLPAAQAVRAAIEELVGEHGVIVLPLLLGGDQLLEVGVILHVHELRLCLDAFPGLMIEGQASLGDVGPKFRGGNMAPDRQGSRQRGETGKGDQSGGCRPASSPLHQPLER